MSGSTFKRCGCINAGTGKQYGSDCPQLGNDKHGTWGFRVRIEGQRIGRGGYPTEKAAAADLRRVLSVFDDRNVIDDRELRIAARELLATLLKTGHPVPTVDNVRQRLNLTGSVAGMPTVGEWCDRWLASRNKIRPSTRVAYEQHIKLYIRPALGRFRLDRLQPEQIGGLYDTMSRLHARKVGEPADELMDALVAARHALRRNDARPVKTATIHRVHATLRAALNAAVKRQVIPRNVATFVELSTVERPPVHVWLPEQVGAFLDGTAEDSFGPLWQLIVSAGLRRGEAVGLRWADVDLEAGVIRIAEQVTAVRGKRQVGPPKSRSGVRIVSLDADMVAVLKARRVRQNEARLSWGEAWQECGRVFTREDGAELKPDSVSQRFERTAARLGLPPIPLHGLRHTSASIGLASGESLHEVKERLGHSTITVTSDYYMHVLPAVAKDSAERRSRVIPRKPSGGAGHTLATRPTPEEEAAAYRPTKPQVRDGGAGRTRTGDQRIMRDTPPLSDEVAG